MIGRLVAILPALHLFLAVPSLALADPTLVQMVNASRPTDCAEEDNLYVTLSGDGIAAFRIEATLPVYLRKGLIDHTAADFTSCDMRNDPVFWFAPQTRTLFEDSTTRLVGHTFTRFWRPTVVPVTVDGVTTEGLHLLQLLHRHKQRWVEVLVLYPADGYWRLKPLPPAYLADSGYGSSFLIGPIEKAGRPFVDLAHIDIDPALGTFRLAFARGGGGLLQVEEMAPGHIVLQVSLDPPVDNLQPFAALRSMFVSPEMADATDVTWRDAPDHPRQTQPIMTFGATTVESVRFGRSIVSRHNTSAPDLTFRGFEKP